MTFVDPSTQQKMRAISVEFPNNQDDVDFDALFAPASQPAKASSDLISRVIRQESGGNPNAVSPKGAFGTMQLMPGTARDPGFGIAPVRDNSDEENRRVGSEYLGALINKYGDESTALIAYNWGPGNTDKWLKAGADPSRLPHETRSYVASIQGGAAKPERPSALAEAFGVTPANAAEAPDFDEMFAPKTPAATAPQKSAAPQKQTEGLDYSPNDANNFFGRELIGQGALAGFGDEAEAAARALAAKTGGDKRSYTELYDYYLKNARTQLQNFEKAHPRDAAAAQVAGAVGGLAVPGPDVVEATEWVGRGINAGAKGAEYGGLYGFGTGEGTGSRVRRAITQGAIGGAVGGVASPVADLAIAGASKALAEPIRAAVNPEATAASKLGSSIAEDQRLGTTGLTDQQIADAQAKGQPVLNVDRGGETTRALMRKTANQSPAARQIIEDAIKDEGSRFETQGDRLTDFLNNTVNSQSAQATREALEQQAIKAKAPAYARAYRDGDKPIWSPELERLSSAPEVVNAIKGAAVNGKSRAVLDGYGGFNPPVNVTPDGRLQFRRSPTGVPTYPNLQFWDYAKRELDNTANVAKRAGDKEGFARASGLASKLRDELDRIVPSYRNARSTAATFFGADNAITAGENFASKKGAADLAGATKAISQMSPAEKQLFKIGFVSRFVDSVSRINNRSDVVRAIWGNPKIRHQIQIALGPSDAKEMDAFMHVEAMLDKPRKALGGSTTARQLAEGGMAGLGYGLYEGNLDPRSLSLDVIIGAALRRGSKAAGARINNKVLVSLAQKLVSDDPAEYQSAIGSIAKSPEIMKAVRAAVAIPTATSVQSTN